MRSPYLADKSALARMGTPAVGQRLRPLVDKGEIATCSMVDLEVLFSARSPQEYAAASSDRAQAYPKIPIHQVTMDRAAEVQSALAKRSQHRAASIPDLIIAATAEQAGLTVLHYDGDFDLIAEVTGQPMEWVVPQGSVD